MMFHRLRVLAAAIPMLALWANPAGAQLAVPLAGRERAAMLADGSELWFVEMAGRPTVDAGDPAAIAIEQALFRRSAAAEGLRYRERRSFRRLWNGMAIAIHPDDLGRLKRLSSVAATYPVLEVPLPEEPPDTAPQMLTALEMIGAYSVQHELGVTGAGIRVGVIDTGVDYDHPDLGGDGVPRDGSRFFPNARVVAGWDFVGDENGTDPVPDAFPDDCYGHGTHVAGIIAAHGGITGVAPGALIGAYRVFGCTGVSTTDMIVAALERAHEDRMDVVNLSIGAPFEWPEYPTARAADRLAKQGVVVVAAQGNNGSAGVYAANAPGTGRDVIAVASFQNLMVHRPGFTLSPGDRAATFRHVPGAPPPPLSGTFPVTRTRSITSPGDACLPLAPGSLTGKVALVRAGVCGAYQKALNAQKAGAAAVILYPNSDDDYRPDVTGSPAIQIPVVTVSRDVGEGLDVELTQHAVSLTWTVSSSGNVGSGRISAFSSYGPAPDLSLKPNLGAPGGAVLSTWPLESGGYLNDSGTSMATPQVAGAVALLLEARGRARSDEVRMWLQNNAHPGAWEGDLSRIDHVHRQGAGLIDVRAALEATTEVEPSQLELGESEEGPASRRLTLRNRGPAAVTYLLEHEPAMATGPDPYIVSFHDSPALVSFDRPTITVRGGGVAHVDVTIAPNPALPDQSVYGGYLKLRAAGGGAVVRVPFVGLKGDYQALPTLAPTHASFPWIARLVDGSLAQQPPGAVFSLEPDDQLWIVYHLAHQASELNIELIEMSGGRSRHRIRAERFVPRNTTGASFFAEPWDGRVLRGRRRTVAVPNGSYMIGISALRALGDRNNPAHWDTWTSPAFTLDRQRPSMQTDWDVAQLDPEAAPLELAFAPVRPNPSSGPMTFAFALPHAGPAVIEVFDTVGRRLCRWHWERLGAGQHSIPWDGLTAAGRRAPTGAVLVRLTAAGRTLVRKAVVLP